MKKLMKEMDFYRYNLVKLSGILLYILAWSIQPSASSSSLLGSRIRGRTLSGGVEISTTEQTSTSNATTTSKGLRLNQPCERQIYEKLSIVHLFNILVESSTSDRAAVDKLTAAVEIQKQMEETDLNRACTSKESAKDHEFLECVENKCICLKSGVLGSMMDLQLSGDGKCWSPNTAWCYMKVDGKHDVWDIFKGGICADNGSCRKSESVPAPFSLSFGVCSGGQGKTASSSNLNPRCGLGSGSSGSENSGSKSKGDSSNSSCKCRRNLNMVQQLVLAFGLFMANQIHYSF